VIIKQIKIQEDIFEYSIVLEKRSSTVMRFRDGALQVKAPLDTSIKIIDDWIKTKEDWILRHSRIQAKIHTDDTSMWYLNRKIKLSYQNHTRLGYQLEDNEITILHPKSMKPETALNRVRKQLAIEIILPIMHQMIDITQLRPIKIELKALKISWGRCDSNRNIRLSEKMIECDPQFIEYVCVHELMHLKHMNHSKEFYQAIERILPDYKKRRRMTPYQYGYLT
jgi:predicted metal-dependent hydrolase